MRLNKTSNWSKFHEVYNSNGFYNAHPQLQTAKVDVVYPEEMFELAQWQADKSMFYAMPEIRWLADILVAKFGGEEGPPRTVLDLACGLGRTTVYLKKYFEWDDSKFYMYDSNGSNLTYGSFETASEATFYNDLEMTKRYLTLNDVNNFEIIDARENSFENLRDVDLAYSFLGFGYHFDIGEILPRLENCMTPGGLVIFGTKGFDAGGGLAGRIYNRLQSQLASIDQTTWALLRDARGPERMKCSVLVLERRGGDEVKKSRFKLAPEQNEL